MENIILIGPKSVGKSKVGKELSNKMNLEFYDLDNIVEEKIGPISKYIKKKKYNLVRIKEHEILENFLKSLKTGFVLSVGGGTIASQLKSISKKNLRNLKKKGLIVYLIPSRLKSQNIEILHKREKKRKGDQEISQIKELYNLRKPIYEKAADYKIICGNKSPVLISKQIIKKLGLK